MNRLSRAIAGLAVLSIAAVSVVAATSSPAAGKSAEVVTPQYVKGYWPGEPQLCIGDLTEGLPVAEAVAQFDATNVDMAVSPDCDPDSIAVPVFTGDLDADQGPNGRYTRGASSFRDHADLWVHSPGASITLDARRDLTGQQWLGVIAHELGHLVGLSHTNRLDSVMRRGSEGAADNGQHALTATDVAVINDLYPR